MNKLILACLVFFSSLNALAAARDFRVNRGAVSDNGYAIAWGISGQKVDFEKVEETDQQVDDFINVNASKIHNYLVDLETDSILLDLTGNDPDPEFVDFRLGSVRYGDHFSLGAKALDVDGLSFDQDAVAVMAYNKWTNVIAKVSIVDHSKKITAVQSFDDVNTRINVEIRKKLTREQADLFNNGAYDLSLERTSLDKYGNVALITITCYQPKTDGPTLDIKAYVKLELKSKHLNVSVLSLKAKITKQSEE